MGDLSQKEMIILIISIIGICILGLIAFWCILIYNASKWNKECEDRIKEAPCKNPSAK